MVGVIVHLASIAALRRSGVVLWVAGAIALSSVGWSHALAPATAPSHARPGPADPRRPEPETPRIVPPDEFGRGTPRGAIRGFLSATDARDYERAAAYLDLSRYPTGEAAKQGPVLARHLRVVLDQILPLDPSEFSEEPEGMTNDGQPPSRDVVGRVEIKKGGVTLFLERVSAEDGVPIWKVAAGTVARIPSLYDEFGHGPAGEVLPSMFVETRLFDIALWQWIALLCLVPAALLVASILVMPGGWLLRVLSARGRLPLALRIAQEVGGPVRLLIAVGLFHVARRALSLAAAVHPVFVTVEEVLVVVGATWLILRVIDAGGGSVRQAMEGQRDAATIAVVDLAQRSLTLVVLLLGFFSFLQALGVHVTALIAGLGVGGIAFVVAVL